jgi:deazaflavin-dependent oxidoreductase (nitroreductase family)
MTTRFTPSGWRRVVLRLPIWFYHKLTARLPDRGWRRITMRLPIWLYRLRLGWLLGDRFLLLTHIGRRSRMPRQTVLEVGIHDTVTDTYIIASAWGERPDWYRNIQQTPNVLVDVGRRRFAATAERLSEAAAVRTLRDYAHRHPVEFRILANALIGQQLSDTDDIYRRLAESVPLIALRPKT